MGSSHEERKNKRSKKKYSISTHIPLFHFAGPSLPLRRYRVDIYNPYGGQLRIIVTESNNSQLVKYELHRSDVMCGEHSESTRVEVVRYCQNPFLRTPKTNKDR